MRRTKTPPASAAVALPRAEIEEPLAVARRSCETGGSFDGSRHA
jgi:hypothetical protein